MTKLKTACKYFHETWTIFKATKEQEYVDIYKEDLTIISVKEIGLGLKQKEKRKDGSK